MTLYLSRPDAQPGGSGRGAVAAAEPPGAGRGGGRPSPADLVGLCRQRERKRDFLWRHDGRGRFYTLSSRPPQSNGLFNPPETKVFNPVLRPGDRLQFTLRANATKDRAAVSRMEKSARRGKSRRVDVVMDLLRTAPEGGKRAAIRDHTAQAAAEAWMNRQGTARGFEPRRTLVEGYSTIELGRRRRQGATFGILDLTGVLVVTDPDAFLAALAAGIGRAKAWGCGLMLIRRVG